MTGSKGQLLWGVCIAMPWFGVIALTVPAHQPELRMRRMAKRNVSPNDPCASDSDCPIQAVCQRNTCYCDNGLCNSKYLPACLPLVKRNETCVELTTTTEWPTDWTSLVTGPQTPRPELTTTTQRPTQRTSPVTGPQTPRTELTTTTQRPTQRTSPVTGPQTPRPENRRCQLQFNKELQECEDSMNQNGFCNLLRQNARIQEASCHRNSTNVTAQRVANEVSEILNHTTLNNLTTSELRSAFTSIVETVETSLLETFSNSPQNQNISTPEMEVQMKVSRDICGRDTSITLTVLENTMQVPCAHVSGSKDGAILISYIGLESKLNGSAFGALGDNNPEDGEKINSPIVSGAITSPNTANLEPPVAFHLKQLTDVPPSFILQCVFWDLELKIWSRRGCETHKSDRVNSTFCVCNHLSTFAVLMAPSDIQVDYGLVLISRIGLSVSLVCLCLSLLTFLLCRPIRSAHTSVLTALCGCLFIGQLLALFGLHQTGYKVLCAVIAGLLQFSFLCAFCWMSLESALLFMTVRNLQAMNYMTSKRSLFPYSCIAGFGIPLIIIIISAAIRPDGYGTEKYCWLRQDLVWSFLGPVCVFITINFILLVTTFVLLKKKIASLNANVSTLKQTRLLTFKALSQLFILGCTWILGIFQFGSGSMVMSYVFTICNSFQGLYIFCVHCLLNRQVMEEYRRGFRRLRSRRSDSEVTSGTTLPMTRKSQSQVSEVQKLEMKSAENHYDS